MSVATRPDISYAVKELSRFLNNPGPVMVKAAKRVLRYVMQTQKLGLIFHSTPKQHIGSIFTTTRGGDSEKFTSFLSQNCKKIAKRHIGIGGI